MKLIVAGYFECLLEDEELSQKNIPTALVGSEDYLWNVYKIIISFFQ